MVKGARYSWAIPSAEQRELARGLLGCFNLSLPILQILVNRGYTRQEDIESFIFMTREVQVHDPELLYDGRKGVERLVRAINDHEKILIVGDYDVDGMTATAMMMACLIPLGAEVNFFLPHRVRDGYGISSRIVERAAASGYSLLITVDNGISAFDAAVKARDVGIDLIITDHHRPHGEKPPAYAIINPQQKECAYPFKDLAGVGVAYKFLELLYREYGKTLPSEVQELLLLGTIADVVPLRNENRFLVKAALHHVAKVESVALRVLRENVRLTKQISSLDIGFFLAPQLNALGRLEDPRQAVKFLIGGDEAETAQIGRTLFELNQARKQVEKAVVEDVRSDIAAGRIDPCNDYVFIASRASWPPGVIGLAASRIVAEFGRPVFLFHETESGMLKGSCRSIRGLNIFDALVNVRDLLLQFGGHAAAAGLALKKEKLPEFKMRFEAYTKTVLTEDDFKLKLVCDAELSLADAQAKCMRDLRYLEPFGQTNERPLFYVRGVQLMDRPVLLKEEHVKSMVCADGVMKPVIFFGRPDLFEFFNQHYGADFDLAVSLTENEWDGQCRIELHGVDAALSTKG